MYIATQTQVVSVFDLNLEWIRYKLVAVIQMTSPKFWCALKINYDSGEDLFAFLLPPTHLEINKTIKILTGELAHKDKTLPTLQENFEKSSRK